MSRVPHHDIHGAISMAGRQYRGRCAAAVVALDDTDRVCLVRQYRHGIGDFLWEIPAGKLDAGEAPQSLYAFEGLVNNHVYALGVREDGETLAGTLGGLSLVRHETVQRNLTATNSGLKHNWVTAIVLDEKDGWDIGTYGAGVMQMSHDGTVTALTPAFVVNPNAMLRTRNHLLVGSLSNGLWVETLSTGKWSDVLNGLPSKNVTALAERDGAIYVGTDNGLVKIAEESLGQ